MRNAETFNLPLPSPVLGGGKGGRMGGRPERGLAWAVALSVLVVGCRNLPIDDATAAAPAARGVDHASLRRALDSLGSAPCDCGFGRR